MESLAHLVAESLGRHGFEPVFDHRRLQWSNWFHCQDRFSLVLAPCKPGLFALGEEVIAPGELVVGEGRRMLALFQITEANDLGMALGRLFLSGNPVRERFASGRCFARYVVIEDAIQRRTALTALQRWMASSAEAVSGVPQAISDDTNVPPDNHVAPDALVRGAEQSSAGFAAGHDFPSAELISRHNSENDGSVSECNVDNPGFVAGHDFSRAAISTPASAAAFAKPTDASEQPESSNKEAQIGPPPPIPSGF
jgi:hypothetical protein